MSDQLSSHGQEIGEDHAHAEAALALADEAGSADVLVQARDRATAAALTYAGDISPEDAFDLVKS